MPSEKPLLNKLMLAATAAGARLFRNNVGKAWVGQSTRFAREMTVRVMPGDVLIRDARVFHGGLAKGSADLIGWVPRVIRQEDVGKRVAMFASVEAKTPGVPVQKEQQAWQLRVQADGGLGLIVWNEGELASVLEPLRDA